MGHRQAQLPTMVSNFFHTTQMQSSILCGGECGFCPMATLNWMPQTRDGNAFDRECVTVDSIVIQSPTCVVGLVPFNSEATICSGEREARPYPMALRQQIICRDDYNNDDRIYVQLTRTESKVNQGSVRVSIDNDLVKFDLSDLMGQCPAQYFHMKDGVLTRAEVVAAPGTEREDFLQFNPVMSVMFA